MPKYLTQNIKLNNVVHNYKTRNSNNFFINSQQTVTMQKSLFQSGLSQFNQIPTDIKDEVNLKRFKQKLSNYVKLNYNEL